MSHLTKFNITQKYEPYQLNKLSLHPFLQGGFRPDTTLDLEKGRYGQNSWPGFSYVCVRCVTLGIVIWYKKIWFFFTHFVSFFSIFTCTADVRFEFCSKPYLVTMEVYTMGVLVLFNGGDVRTFQEIQEMTKLPMEVLQKHLQLLVGGQVLKTEVSCCLLIELMIFSCFLIDQSYSAISSSNQSYSAISWSNQSYSAISWSNQSYSAISWSNQSYSVVSWSDQSYSVVSWLDQSYSVVSWSDQSYSVVSWSNQSYSLVSWSDQSYSVVSWSNQSYSAISWLNQSYSVVSWSYQSYSVVSWSD